MGISINLYRVGKAEAISDLKNLEEDMEAALQDQKVDLYKMTEDLAVIFLNSVDPFDDENTIPYKMLFGNRTLQIVDLQQTPGLTPNSRTESIGGFIPTSEVETIVDWIKEKKMDSLEGFTETYDELSDGVKTKLDEMGSPDNEELFEFYVKPLTHFYFKAKEDHNSIVITGE